VMSVADPGVRWLLVATFVTIGRGAVIVRPPGYEPGVTSNALQRVSRVLS
jgi:hypothetical protein